MKPIDKKRLARLFRWTLDSERSYLLKSFYQIAIVMALMLMLYSWSATRMAHPGRHVMQLGAILFSVSLLIQFVMAGSYMFYSLADRNSLQRLLLLPASNAEKFLARYSIWLIMLPLTVAALLVADVVQLVFNLAIQNEEPQLIVAYMAGALPRLGDIASRHGLSLVLGLAWLHSVYVLGANFIYNRKYAWIVVTAALLAALMLVGSLPKVGSWNGAYGNGWLLGRWAHGLLADKSATVVLLRHATAAALTVLNFWLSYRLFCRRQIRGRFIVR